MHPKHVQYTLLPFHCWQLVDIKHKLVCLLGMCSLPPPRANKARECCLSKDANGFISQRHSSTSCSLSTVCVIHKTIEFIYIWEDFHWVAISLFASLSTALPPNSLTKLPIIVESVCLWVGASVGGSLPHANCFYCWVFSQQRMPYLVRAPLPKKALGRFFHPILIK